MWLGVGMREREREREREGERGGQTDRQTDREMGVGMLWMTERESSGGGASKVCTIFLSVSFDSWLCRPDRGDHITVWGNRVNRETEVV